MAKRNLDIGYRADIDGLRALAVIPVVLFHAGIPLFSGGYVGVDIFFVISGYLITGILLSSIEKRTFSIYDFYVRRIKRIFPALLLVIFVSFSASLIFFSPDRLIDFGRSMMATSIFSSNLYFWKSVGYFSTNAHVKPLLHTWSLAVEEQFYIFYPICLYAVIRLGWRLELILTLCALLSLTAAIFLLSSAPSAIFYLLPFRAWELIVGGLLATGRLSRPQTLRTSFYSAAIGIVMMVAPMVLYTADTAFPGFAAIPPVIGAALVIWSGGSSLHRIFAKSPLVRIGKASYSFYLWHYPIFAFATYLLNRALDPLTGSVLSIISLLLALATLRFVEDPIRHARSRAAWAAPLLLMASTGSIGLVLAFSDGLPDRFSLRTQAMLSVVAEKNQHPIECMSNGDLVVYEPCLLGAAGVQPSALLLGDSHAMVTATAMDSAARRAGKSFLFLATADCPPGLGFEISTDYEPKLSTTPSYRSCGEYNRRMVEVAKQVPIVVISARWSNWRIGEPPNPVETPVDLRLIDKSGSASSQMDNARIFEAGFRRLIKALSGKKIYVVGPIPEPTFDVPQTMFVARYGLVKPSLWVSTTQFKNRHRKALQIMSRVGDDVEIIWPSRILCRNGQCPLAIDDRPIYFDHNHLSVEGALMTAELYDPIFKLHVD